MSSAPYGVRLLVGVAATAVEETLKLPQTILTYPMTVVSQLAHLVMKVQQDVADLVIKGDATLENFFPPKDEKPEWATFDEDEQRSADSAADAAPRRTASRLSASSHSRPRTNTSSAPLQPTRTDSGSSGGGGKAPARCLPTCLNIQQTRATRVQLSTVNNPKKKNRDAPTTRE